MTLRDYMTQHKLNDRMVADELGVDRTYVNTIRRQIREPSLRLAVKIERWSEGSVRCEDLVLGTTQDECG